MINKIKLLTSANWSQINWDLSWQTLINLDEILPKVGENYQISLEDSEAKYTQNGRYYLLWFPPHSELNTLSDRPTEVLKTHIIEAELSQGDWIKEGYSDAKRNFNAKILSIKKMLEYLPEVQLINRQKISQYFESNSCQTQFLKWNNFCLFILNDQYQHTELLFKIDKKNYYLIYMNDWVSYFYESYICKHLIDAEQILFLEKYMIAENKLPSYVNELENEPLIQGASYM